MAEIWLAPTFGIIVGKAGGSGGSSEEEEDNSYHGFLSLGNMDFGLYIGGILGLGESIGPYATAGLMIGSNPDIGVGGGIHLGKKVGIGVIMPTSYIKHASENPGTALIMHHLAYVASHFPHAISYFATHAPSISVKASTLYQALQNFL